MIGIVTSGFTSAAIVRPRVTRSASLIEPDWLPTVDALVGNVVSGASMVTAPPTLASTPPGTRKMPDPMTAPMMNAPDLGLNLAGPKSGAQRGSASLAASPSYSPARMSARLRRSSPAAAYS